MCSRNKQKAGEGLGGLWPSLNRFTETEGLYYWCGGTLYCGQRANVPRRLGCLRLGRQPGTLLGGSGNLRRSILEEVRSLEGMCPLKGPWHLVLFWGEGEIPLLHHAFPACDVSAQSESNRANWSWTTISKKCEPKEISSPSNYLTHLSKWRATVTLQWKISTWVSYWDRATWNKWEDSDCNCQSSLYFIIPKT